MSESTGNQSATNDLPNDDWAGMSLSEIMKEIKERFEALSDAKHVHETPLTQADRMKSRQYLGNLRYASISKLVGSKADPGVAQGATKRPNEDSPQGSRKATPAASRPPPSPDATLSAHAKSITAALQYLTEHVDALAKERKEYQESKEYRDRVNALGKADNWITRTKKCIVFPGLYPLENISLDFLEAAFPHECT